MAIHQWLRCRGLALDIVGVCLLFWFGYNSRLPPSLDGAATEHANEDPRVIRRVKLLAHVGLIAIVVGFLLQIAGSVLRT